ncbi:McrB family protein [Chryseobacterium gwangjuense]|uniref:McrB family protein n=1 Tax=Chryseobacterium gwangjuense TaxID=1069980 RepID=UPI001E2E41F6|nr:AAA family ATPase [Chryseobacterium gwangjuense]MCE3074654.1 AAA family ATPase [Chryseobacterium gwangjuense]
MNFFEKQEIDILTQYSSKLKTNDLQSVYDNLKTTYKKVEYWASLVKEKVFKEGEIKIIKKPTNQANIFEFYQWAKIYPSKEDLKNKILAYTVSVEKNEKLVIKIDSVGLSENSLLRKEYYRFRKDNIIVKEYYLKDFSGWDDLVNITVRDIMNFEPLFYSLKEILIQKNKTTIKMMNSENKKDIIPINQILYGPPGTGKTYNTIVKAVKIANPNFHFTDRERIKKEYERLVDNEQIVFTTFHQSMSYEDFIEGIKPDVKKDNVIYDIIPGIFVELCSKAKDNLDSSKDKDVFHLPFESAFSKFKDEWEEDDSMKFPLKTKGKDYTIIGFTKKSIQFKKSSGSTSHTLSINTLKEYYYNKREVKKSGVGIYYPAILEKLYDYPNDVNAKSEVLNYVLIIDEINRGNVSNIFGELITLIEESKRIGNSEELQVTLPYSKEKFGVPSNLYIIGTMNTADRSIEALDTALRRRFCFEEMLPITDLLTPSAMYCRLLWKYESVDWSDREFVEKEEDLFNLLNVSTEWIDKRKDIWSEMKVTMDKNKSDYFKGFNYSGVNLKNLLETINKRIEVLLDRDHTIGHSYFIDVYSFDDLKKVFKNNIIPLLQEYFYGDYEKIGWILGEGFFIEKELDKKLLFTKFFRQSKPEFELKYQLVDVDKIDMKIAVQKLLGIFKEEKELEYIEN